VAGECIVDLLPAGIYPALADLGLSAPEDIAVDHRGNLVIADTGNHRVLIVDSEGTIVQEFGGYGWDAGEFDSPSDLAVDPGFFIYVLDEGNRRIQRFNDDGDLLDLVQLDDASETPVGIDLGRSGEILLADEISHSVEVFSQFAEALEPIGQFGLAEGGLVRPRGVAVGPGGEIAVPDPGRGTVEVYDEFGGHLYALSASDTLEAEDVIFDEQGWALVSDVRHARVLAFPPGGGPAAAAYTIPELLWPAGLALDTDGRLLVLDSEIPCVLFIEIVHGECPRDD